MVSIILFVLSNFLCLCSSMKLGYSWVSTSYSKAPSLSSLFQFDNRDYLAVNLTVFLQLVTVRKAVELCLVWKIRSNLEEKLGELVRERVLILSVMSLELWGRYSAVQSQKWWLYPHNTPNVTWMVVELVKKFHRVWTGTVLQLVAISPKSVDMPQRIGCMKSPNHHLRSSAAQSKKLWLPHNTPNVIWTVELVAESHRA